MYCYFYVQDLQNSFLQVEFRKDTELMFISSKTLTFFFSKI